MTGVLGVPTIEYLPYAFFNIANPLIALAFGFIGVGVERLSGPKASEETSRAARPEKGKVGRPTVD
jgi:NhaC family Na+:H+ antiporter